MNVLINYIFRNELTGLTDGCYSLIVMITINISTSKYGRLVVVCTDIVIITIKAKGMMR